jgi:hypothetical protein
MQLMESVKNWLLSQGLWILRGLTFAVAGAFASFIWRTLAKVEKSQLGIVLRLLICLPAIIAGWVIFGIFLLDFGERATEVAKRLFEGPWISIVIFKAIPKKGEYVALPFVALYGVFECYITYLGFVEQEHPRFGVTEAVVALLAIITSLGTYLYLAYSNRARTQTLAATNDTPPPDPQTL